MEQDKYQKLRYQLMESEKWPVNYMFKFVISNRDGKVDLVKSYLPTHGTISFKHTKNLKYVAITCIVLMESADKIIEIMEKVDQVAEVIQL